MIAHHVLSLITDKKWTDLIVIVVEPLVNRQKSPNYVIMAAIFRAQDGAFVRP
jgi:hypothetical protein